MQKLFKERQEKVNEFLKNRNKLPSKVTRKELPAEVQFLNCPDCRQILKDDDLMNNNYVCPHCHYYFYLSPRERLNLLGFKFQELFTDLTTKDNGFPGYKDKIESLCEATDDSEAVTVGIAKEGRLTFALGIMNANFLMGSMGYVVGERITRLIEEATKRKIPLVLFTASGGARMQEGIVSLMQMAKTNAALSLFKKTNQPYIAVITNPTYGGVSASFASVADITIAEPKALYGFAGRRVIENTIKEKLPKNFQTAEIALNNGLIDMIVKRENLKDTLVDLMLMLKENK